MRYVFFNIPLDSGAHIRNFFIENLYVILEIKKIKHLLVLLTGRIKPISNTTNNLI